VAIPLGILLGAAGAARAVELRNAGMIGQIVETPGGPARIVAITRGGVVVLEPARGLRMPAPPPPPSEVTLVYDPATGVWSAPQGSGSALATVPRAPARTTPVAPVSSPPTTAPVPRPALPVPVTLPPRLPAPRAPAEPVREEPGTAPAPVSAVPVPAQAVPVPSTPRTLAADERVATTQDALAAAVREAGPARGRVASARADVVAARDLAAEPGAGREGARLLRQAEDSLRRAEAQLRPRSRSESVARREVAEAARARAEIIRLEREIARLDRLIDTELNPPGGFTLEQIREGRRAGIRPLAESRLQPSGREYNRLVGLRTAAQRQLTSETDALTGSLADQVTAATPGRASRAVAMANAAELAASLRPVGGRPIDVTTGRPMTTSAWATDHLMSRSEIARDPRFSRLSPLDRDDILRNVPENFLPLTVEANSSKGGLSVDDWISARAAAGRPLPPDVVAVLRAADVRARAAVEARFRRFTPR
jgi:hypothetical protein